MDKMPELWQNGPKVHKRIYQMINAEMDLNWTFEDIYRLVAASDITDDDDILVTTRALVAKRDARRKWHEENKSDAIA